MTGRATYKSISRCNNLRRFLLVLRTPSKQSKRIILQSGAKMRHKMLEMRTLRTITGEHEQ